MSADDPRAWISGVLVFLAILAGMWVHGRLMVWLHAERCPCGTRLRICPPCERDTSDPAYMAEIVADGARSCRSLLIPRRLDVRDRREVRS